MYRAPFVAIARPFIPKVFRKRMANQQFDPFTPATGEGSFEGFCALPVLLLSLQSGLG